MTGPKTGGRSTVRQGFLPVCAAAVKGNRLFSELLKHKVTFYRRKLPAYASIIHPGGAPDWVVRKWLELLSRIPSEEGAETIQESPVLNMISKDLAELGRVPTSFDDVIRDLLDRFAPQEEVQVGEVSHEDVYSA